MCIRCHLQLKFTIPCHNNPFDAFSGCSVTQKIGASSCIANFQLTMENRDTHKLIDNAIEKIFFAHS